MRSTLNVSAAALGASAWCPLDYVKTNFKVSLAFSLSTGGSGTAKVQHTFDNPQLLRHPGPITRSGTVATVNDPAHGLSTGDSLLVTGTGDPNLDTTADVDITAIDADNYSYVVANTGALVARASARVRTLRVFDHAQMTGMTGRTDGNYDFPPMACRLRITSAGAGVASLRVIQGFH